MEAADLHLAPTLFEHAAKLGVSSALLSSKKKTISLLRRGTAASLTAEAPSAEWVDRLGPAPPIYSREINYWMVRAAIYILKHQPELQCVYVHTTDYPMHTWAPDAAESKEHLKTMDTLLGEAYESAPDAQFLLTADHGMNHKTRAYYLDKALTGLGIPIRISISAERDRFVKHPRGLGGAAWIYL
jgi:phosphonoacetate hydrolase